MNYLRAIGVAVIFYGLALVGLFWFDATATGDAWITALLGLWTACGYLKVFRGAPRAESWMAALRGNLMAWAWPVLDAKKA